MDGSCLASPRWVSLLVAEIYYPDATFPNPAPSAAAPVRSPVSQNRSPVPANSPPSVRILKINYHNIRNQRLSFGQILVELKLKENEIYSVVKPHPFFML
jgi:energy-converting hydrogenase Eha subunit F